jgi:hypothetical protein
MLLIDERNGRVALGLLLLLSQSYESYVHCAYTQPLVRGFTSSYCVMSSLTKSHDR